MKNSDKSGHGNKAFGRRTEAIKHRSIVILYFLFDKFCEKNNSKGVNISGKIHYRREIGKYSKQVLWLTYKKSLFCLFPSAR
ncbi:MAG: hypothetical protein PHV51_08060 [Methanosarcinaceae archaeon]|nr:hypothetical protein [Methanosarcinaceae archaeon]MDD4498084.1 hypothetical protein [Methanosarcinaceae archaeon]